MTLINRGVRQMLRKRRQKPQKYFNNNKSQKNDDQCYCEKQLSSNKTVQNEKEEIIEEM